MTWRFSPRRAAETGVLPDAFYMQHQQHHVAGVLADKQPGLLHQIDQVDLLEHQLPVGGEKGGQKVGRRQQRRDGHLWRQRLIGPRHGGDQRTGFRQRVRRRLIAQLALVMFAGFDLQPAADPQKEQKGVGEFSLIMFFPLKKALMSFSPAVGWW